MPLTSQQKHYIKKNIKKLSPDRIASDLGLSQQEVERYLEKHLPHNYKQSRNTNYIIPEQMLNTKTLSLNLHEFVAKNIYVFMLLFLLVLISYFNSMDNTFVSDDIPNILKNDAIGNASNLFAGHFSAYVGNLINFIAYRISGTSPVIFKSFAIFFHLGTVFSVYVLLSLLFKKRIAVWASALFAVHPILVESVTWTSGNPYCRYSFFFLISLIFYLLSKNNKKYYYLSVLFFALSLLSSTSAPVAFLIFFLHEVSFGNIRQSWKKLIPFAFLGATSVLFFLTKIGERTNQVGNAYNQQPETMNPFLQIPVAIGSYLKLIFWPQKLSLYQTEMSFTIGQYLIFLFVFSMFLWIIFYGWKKNKPVFFWLVFFVITLLPTLTPFGISWIVAERYVYLGSLGIFAVFALAFDQLIKKYEDKKQILYAVFAVIIIILSIRTITRNIDWHDEDHLWIATAKTSPSGPNTHNNLGDVYSRQGKPEKAAEEFLKAIEINPYYADAYHNLGIAYVQMDKKQEAIKLFEKAAELNPNLLEAYQNLAAIYFDKSDYSKALEYNKKALEISPNNQVLLQGLQLIESKLK